MSQTVDDNSNPNYGPTSCLFSVVNVLELQRITQWFQRQVKAALKTQPILLPG